jgi:hypothetical protein
MSDELHPHQCAYCELRFRYASEIKEHVINDHPSHRASYSTSDPREHVVPHSSPRSPSP